jgi:hypothetical protein
MNSLGGCISYTIDDKSTASEYAIPKVNGLNEITEEPTVTFTIKEIEVYKVTD